MRLLLLKFLSGVLVLPHSIFDYLALEDQSIMHLEIVFLTKWIFPFLLGLEEKNFGEVPLGTVEWSSIYAFYKPNLHFCVQSIRYTCVLQSFSVTIINFLIFKEKYKEADAT